MPPDLPPELVKTLSELPPEARKILLTTIEYSRHEQHWIGPLPPPNILAEYEQIVPGSAAMLFGQFKAQSDHRMSLERKHMTHSQYRSYLGTVLGTIISITAIIGSVHVASSGSSIEGMAGVIAALVALMYALKSAGDRQMKERLEKENIRSLLNRLVTPTKHGHDGEIDRSVPSNDSK